MKNLIFVKLALHRSMVAFVKQAKFYMIGNIT